MKKKKKKETGKIKPVNPRDLYNNNTSSLLYISASTYIIIIIIIEYAGVSHTRAGRRVLASSKGCFVVVTVVVSSGRRNKVVVFRPGVTGSRSDITTRGLHANKDGRPFTVRVWPAVRARITFVPTARCPPGASKTCSVSHRGAKKSGLSRIRTQ